LKLSGAAWKIEYQVFVDHLLITENQDFARTRLWHVIGPFPGADGKAFDTAFPPEQGVDLAKAVDVSGGSPLAWHPAIEDVRGFVDLTKAIGRLEKACAYAVIYVESPRARSAVLSAGSDDGIKAWINGQRVLSHDIARGAAPGQEKAEVELRAGWNEVLLKITQDQSGWGFYLDLLGEDGQPLPDSRYAPKPGG
jgi:hypothetical protein